MFCWKCEIQNPDWQTMLLKKCILSTKDTDVWLFFPACFFCRMLLWVFFPIYCLSCTNLILFFFLPIASHILYFLTIFLSLLCCRVLSPLICCWLFLWFLFPCILLFPLYKFAHTVSTLFFLSRFFSHAYRVVSGGCGMTLWGNRSPPSSLETSTALLRSTEVTTGYLQFASSSLSPYLLY